MDSKFATSVDLIRVQKDKNWTSENVPCSEELMFYLEDLSLFFRNKKLSRTSTKKVFLFITIFKFQLVKFSTIKNPGQDPVLTLHLEPDTVNPNGQH